MNTYAGSGVDIDAADAFTADIAPSVAATWGSNVVGRFGDFAAGITIPPEYTDPVLMMTTDGVGTKLDLARRLNRFEGVGNDLVAMCVDDLAAQGAAPLGFTDYLAVGRLDRERDSTIVKSIAAACRLAGCALLGGETAVHPGVMPPDQVDLAGAALGVCNRSSLMQPESILPGDRLVGIESPNLRSNGFSLVRAIFSDADLRRPLDGSVLGEVLLEPSVVYAPAVLAATARTLPKAMAHITGGGLTGNLPRVLPAGMGARVFTKAWQSPPIFDLLQSAGEIERDEMFRTFNMGIGFVVIVESQSVDEMVGHLERAGLPAATIGDVVEGSGVALE